MDQNDHFVALQNAVLARLQAVDTSLPALAPANGKSVTYITEQKGDLESLIAKGLSSLGGGIAAIVLTPTALMLEPDSADLAMRVPVMVQVQENVIINQGTESAPSTTGTRIPALRLVSFIMRRLHNWPHRLYPGSIEEQRLRLDPKPFVLMKDGTPLTYNVAASAMLDLSATLVS